MTNPVPFLDVGAACAELRDEISQSISRVLDSGWFVLGEELDSFEREFAAYVGADYCAGTGSGLDALRLALYAHGIGPGDEVIVPSNTFIATWLSVTQVGAVPVPVDPDPETYNLDPYKVDQAVGKCTRAIIPVHLYGRPADLDSINAIAKENNITVIEDAAQAHGARYKGRTIGSDGNTVAWSFYPGKNLGALGDAGAVTSNDETVIAKIKSLRNYGSSAKYVHEEQGINSRLDEIQAAVLKQKLSRLDEWNGRRKAIAQQYLAGIDNERISLPRVDDEYESVWHLFVIKTEERSRLIEYLSVQEINTAIHYPVCVHQQKAYSDMDFSKYPCPVGEKIQHEVLSLPIGPHMRQEQFERVINVLSDFK